MIYCTMIYYKRQDFLMIYKHKPDTTITTYNTCNT